MIAYSSRGMVEFSDIAVFLDKRVHSDLRCRELGFNNVFPQKPIFIK